MSPPEKRFRPYLTLATLVVFATLVIWRMQGSEDYRDKLQSFVFSGATMGTTWQVKIISQKLSPEERKAVQEAVQRALDSVNGKMSTYLPDSELSLLNRTHSLAPQPLSIETLAVLRDARRVFDISGGAFDPTVGPLVDAWGFGPDEVGGPPSEEDIADLLRTVGFDRLLMDDAAGTVTKTVPGLRIDLSAIAKGYGVDVAAAALAKLGHERFMVEVGGEIVTRGTNERGEAFRIGVERPEVGGGRAVYDVVAMKDLAVATSGDYRNYKEVDGKRISHTIDPRTGRPVRHRLASVSVIHGQCAMADALATALNVLGPDEGLKLALDQSLAAQLIVRAEDGTFQKRTTPAFDALVVTESKE